MMEKTMEEKLFHQLVRLERIIRRPGCERDGFDPNGRGRVFRRPPLAREHVLFMISSAEGGVRQKDLIDRAHVNPSSMSEFISRLEEDGYLKREVDPEDRRATLLSLSELGEARIRELRDERAERLQELFGKLSGEEKEELSALLAKILPERKCHRRHHQEEEL